MADHKKTKSFFSGTMVRNRSVLYRSLVVFNNQCKILLGANAGDVIKYSHSNTT